MSELTFGRIDPLPAVATGRAGDQGRRRGDHEPPPKRRRRRAPAEARLIEDVLPGASPHEYVITIETTGGQLTAVTITREATGEIVLTLSPEQLHHQAPAPGLLFEQGA